MSKYIADVDDLVVEAPDRSDSAEWEGWAELAED